MATFRHRGSSWTAIVRKKKGGKIVHQETRTFTGLKAEALARDWAARAEARIERDGVPQRLASVTTLGALLLRHLQVLESTRPLGRSRASHLGVLATEFAEVPLSSLTSSLFSDYAQRRRATGAGPATVLYDLSVLRAALGTAKPLYGIEVTAQPVKDAIKALSDMKVVARPRKRTRRPTGEELAQLTAEFERVASYPSTKIPMAAITALAVALPRRLGELTAMLWSDLFAARGGKIVVLRDTKNPSEPRDETVPVLPEAAAIIETLPVIDERILPYNSESVSAAWQRACKRLNIEDLHFHDLRREGISRLFEAGYTIPEVAKMSGHLDWSMLQIYTKLSPQNILEKFA